MVDCGAARCCGFIFMVLMQLAVRAQEQTTYLFTLPRMMSADETSVFCLMVKDIEQGEVQIRITYMPLEDAMDVSTQSYTYSSLELATSEVHICENVANPGERGTYNVSVEVGLVTLDGTSYDIFQETKDVYVGKAHDIVLIQTDKPIYKPAETVKFRVLTIDSKFMASKITYDEITINSPGDLRMMQWRDVPAPSGLISLEMPLSSDPLLGTWTISVKEAGRMETQTFEVSEYVLPKFEVTITPPKYLLPTTKTISGTVCAKYTYGKPVTGLLKMQMCLKSYYSYHRGDPRPCADIIADINGCYEYHIDAHDIRLIERRYGTWGWLHIEANVTEADTGVEMSTFNKDVSLSRNTLRLDLEDDSDGYFKPGFPYRGRVKVTNPDGSPAPGEIIAVKGHNYDQEYEWTNNFTSDAQGMVHFTITEFEPMVGSMSLEAFAVVYDNDWRYTDDELHIRTWTDTAYKTLTKWFSPSNSYIYIPDVDETLDCDSQITLDVYFSSEPDVEYTLMTMIQDADLNIRDSMVSRVTPTLDPTIRGIEPDQLLIKQKKERYFEPPLPPFPPMIEDLGPMPVFEDPIIPELYVPLGETVEESPPEPPAPKDEEDMVSPPVILPPISYYSLTVPVSSVLAPTATLLVYYIREDKEVVASSIKLNVKNCFRNKVKMEFTEKEARPGSEVTLNLEASQSSVCFLGMMDKSVTLLAGNNQITPEQFFSQWRSHTAVYHWFNYHDDDEAHCKENYPELYEDIKMKWSWYNRVNPVGKNAVNTFRDSKIWIATNAAVETRPCVKREEVVYARRGYLGSRMEGMEGPVALASPEMAVDMQVEQDSDAGPDPPTASQPITLRSLFPETWLWDIVSLGDGEDQLSMPLTIPDTITEWVGNSLCSSPTDGVGMSELTRITAFQPFFVSLTLPYSAIRGEVLPIKLTVFNYLQECIAMEVELRETEGFEFMMGRANSRRFCLCGDDSETTTIHIIPTVVGEIDIEAVAVSIMDDNGVCNDVNINSDSVGVSDGVQRQLLVEAEGLPQDFTTSAYMCSNDAEDVNLILPPDLVPDSRTTKVSVVGDIMGPTLNNLENLLRMPYGCGEQNMASWAPNIYVLQYLNATDQATEEITDKAKGFMRVGYQRQMKYRHNENSYSAFGENSYGNATGSLWLTAFVIKSMAQSSDFITIDMELVESSAAWIVSHQMENGCFPTVGKVFSSYMKGGLDKDNPASLTAFTLIALLEADLGEQFEEPIFLGFKNCLDKIDVAEQDTYSLSLTAYAYSLYDPMSSRMSDIQAELMRRVVNDIPGQNYWQRSDIEPRDPDCYWCWYRASSAEVEMTSYVLMSRLMVAGDDQLDNEAAIVQWMTKQRNAYGGFSSTQDTVVALQALALFGGVTYTGDVALSVYVNGTRNKWQMDVNQDNALLYQAKDVPASERALQIYTQGSGCALVQVQMKYNVYTEMDKGPAFSIKTSVHRSKLQKNNCARRTLHVCTSYLRNGFSNMAIAEIKMPTGWIPVDETLAKLVDEGIIAKFEIEHNYVELYFDEISAEKTCVEFDVEQIIQMSPKAARVTVYDYYETSHKATREYNIKTTCGTKEEIPVDNEGIDCSIMQCREIDGPSPEELVTCPSCPMDLPSIEVIEELVCTSTAVYKSIVGRPGDYPIKIKSDLRPKKKITMDAFVTYKMGVQCSCPILEKMTDTRAMIFTKEKSGLDLNKWELKLTGGDTILRTKSRKIEKTIRNLASRKKLCMKLGRLKRSGSKRNESKIEKLRQKYKLVTM